MSFLTEARKAVAAAGSAAAVAASAGLITGDVKVWITGGIAVVATFLATYSSKPNAAKYAPEHEEGK